MNRGIFALADMYMHSSARMGKHINTPSHQNLRWLLWGLAKYTEEMVSMTREADSLGAAATGKPGDAMRRRFSTEDTRNSAVMDFSYLNVSCKLRSLAILRCSSCSLASLSAVLEYDAVSLPSQRAMLLSRKCES